MLRFRSGGLGWMAAIVSLWCISGCGGHPPAGQSQFSTRVSLSPSATVSVQMGNFIGFTASAQNGAGTTLRTTITYLSSDTTIFNISPNGVGCAGRFDATFSNCIPGNEGLVTVTATALGATSAPTYVFVHPPIDNIVVKGVLLDGLPVQQPCLTQGQTMTIQAYAYSQGSDISQSVGPFTWTANNSSVVQITPLVNIAFNFPTNQATVKAVNPGLTYIYATASGVTSNAFVQPSPYKGASLNFFETCPIQNITLQLGPAGSQQSGQTTFSVAKGNSQTVTATVTDVFGNQLSKVPLTWTASQPGTISVSNGCSESCTVSTPLPGAGSVTASCSPPTCNIGFPLVPAGISAPFIPLPVYATTAISGVVTGSSSPNVVYATSLNCATQAPSFCTTGIYSFSTAKATTGAATGMPTNPNSLLSSPAGDRVYMGSDFGAQVISPGNLGTQNSAFLALANVTGSVLAVSNSGTMAVFSDTLHTPNQVFIVNTGNPTSPAVTALNISEASTAAFSPDGLKTFIFGLDSNGLPTLYIYSTAEAMQVVPLAPQTSVNSIAFSTNGAFAYLVEPSIGGGNPGITVLNTCDNQTATDGVVNGNHPQIIPLDAAPVAFKALPDGVHFLALESNGSLEYISALITGIPVATLTQPPTPASSLCPMTVSHTKLPPIELGQGTIQPLNFFVSADGTLIYVLATDRNSILVYDFSTNAVSGIQLLGSTNPTPISADLTVDATTILVAGSDGMVHEISTGIGGADQFQFGFPNLANYLNPFCTSTPASGPCTFNFIAAKP
jgi:hypothetical protein